MLIWLECVVNRVIRKYNDKGDFKNSFASLREPRRMYSKNYCLLLLERELNYENNTPWFRYVPLRHVKKN